MGGVAAGQNHSQTNEGTGILQHGRRPPPRLPPSRHGFKEMASLPIPDDLLAEIFLRLPTPADVICASAACVSFRRLVAGRSFLRRLRRLHAPPLLGFLANSRVFFPVDPPCPSAAAASAVALAADFSFSFLPGPARDWEVLAVRDGRVLLTRPTSDNLSLVVCDPLHRQYLLLPPIPEVEGWVPLSVDSPHRTERQSFLGDDEEEAAEETPFTVISIAQCGNRQAAFVFSSSTGQWRATPWTEGFAFFSHRRYAYGCFYGVTECREKLLVLDTRRMEFSLAHLPPEARGSSDAGQDVDIAIVEAGEGITGMFVLVRYTSNISYLIRRNNGESSSQWQLDKTIPLASSGYFFTGSTGRHLLLYHWGSPSLEPGTFTLDIKTFELEKVFASESGKYAYSNFPPSLLSSPTISSGVENDAEEMLEQGWVAKLKRIATARFGWNSA